MISRRTALSGLAAASLAGATPFQARAQAQLRIRVSTAAPPSDFLARALAQMKTEVDADKVGLAIETYPASTLFHQGTEVPAMQRGNLEMSTMTTFEVAQQMPQYGFFDRGYLFRDYDHMQSTFKGPIGATYRREVAAKMGITILAVAYLGTRQVNLREKHSVRTPADLAGVKLRMTPGAEWLLLGRALGADAVPMGMPELYLALKTGTVDGQENPLSILNAAKLYEVTQQVVLTAHMIQPVFINIATPFWAKLSAAQKAALQTAAVNAAKANDDGRLADEAKISKALAGRGLAITTPDLAAFRANADKVYAASSLARPWDKALLKQIQSTS